MIAIRSKERKEMTSEVYEIKRRLHKIKRRLLIDIAQDTHKELTGEKQQL
jgi:DNA replication initiation complex subunit (GINS family)